MGLGRRGLTVLREEGVGPFAKKSVKYVIEYPRRRRERRQIQRFSREFFDSPEMMQSYVDEFHEGEVKALRRAAQATYEEDRATQTTSMADIGVGSGEKLYSLIRAQKPEMVVETGVANGFSSTVILSALRENGSGTLVSVDFPFREESESEIAPIPDGPSEDILDQFDESTHGAETDYSIVIPPNKEPGWIVPDELRDRWDLRLGRSQRILPCLMCEEGTVDVFFHDSDHRLPCQMFEYEIAWEHLGSGGVLLSDDIHRPWGDFADVREHASKGLLGRGFGYMIK